MIADFEDDHAKPKQSRSFLFGHGPIAVSDNVIGGAIRKKHRLPIRSIQAILRHVIGLLCSHIDHDSRSYSTECHTIRLHQAMS